MKIATLLLSLLCLSSNAQVLSDSLDLSQYYLYEVNGRTYTPSSGMILKVLAHLEDNPSELDTDGNGLGTSDLLTYLAALVSSHALPDLSIYSSPEYFGEGNSFWYSSSGFCIVHTTPYNWDSGLLGMNADTFRIDFIPEQSEYKFVRR